MAATSPTGPPPWRARPTPTEFAGWDDTTIDTRVTAMEELGDGTVLLKLERSPFYAEGGGQVSDTGEIAGTGGRATVVDVVRVGDDQVLRARLEEGHLPVGAEVTARVRPGACVARPRRTTPPPTSSTGRCARTSARACARPAPYVGPDKLRFDFTHRGRIEPRDARAHRGAWSTSGWPRTSR